MEDSKDTSVLAQLERWVTANPTQSCAIGAIHVLATIVGKSSATTLMGLEVELKAASDSLKTFRKNRISISACCAIFARNLTRANNEFEDFAACKVKVVERGQSFVDRALGFREGIAQLGTRFINSEKVIMVHGFSRVVLKTLKHAAERGNNFRVLVTESRPDNAGYQMARELAALNIPCELVLDSAVAHFMDRASFVLVGAEGVVENGGIVNKIGTYQVTMVAQALRRPVYVAVESFKFARLFPLGQRDLPESKAQQQPLQPLVDDIPASLEILNPSLDYTPPQFISMLFTDLGILTPSAVSDELIKLYF